MIRINRSVSIGAFIGGMFVAGGAAAAPSLETRCTIRNPTSGVVSSAFSSENCNELYVLPPSVGKASVSAVSPRANLDFCPAVKQVGVIAVSTLTSAATLADKIAKMLADFDPLSDELDALAAELADALVARDIAKGNLDLLEEQKTDLTTDLATAKSDLDLCRLLNPDCTAEQAAYAAAVAALRSFLTTQYIPGKQAYIAAKAEYDASFREYTSKTADLAEALTPLFDLQDKLFNLNTTVTQLYNQYVRLSGFVASLTYSTGWAQAVAAFAAVNPSKSVVRIPIKKPRISASAIGMQGFSTDTPAILAFAIPGVVSGQTIDLMAQPTGTEEFPSLTSELDPNVQYNDVFGDSVGAQINVSLMGACPFYPNGLSGGLVGDINDLTAEVALNAFYTYDLQVRRGYQATYNMSEWVSRVEKVVKKGGFFSSSTLRTVVEDANSSDWFSITFNASVSGFSYTQAEQDRITKEVKGQLQERALLLLARQANLLPATGRPSLPSTQPTGAGLAAAYLMNGCGYWSWCLGGSFVLGVLDSIFGSSQAVADFKRSNSVWVSERVSGVAFTEQTGALTYSK